MIPARMYHIPRAVASVTTMASSPRASSPGASSPRSHDSQKPSSSTSSKVGGAGSSGGLMRYLGLRKFKCMPAPSGQNSVEQQKVLRTVAPDVQTMDSAQNVVNTVVGERENSRRVQSWCGQSSNLPNPLSMQIYSYITTGNPDIYDNRNATRGVRSISD